MGREASHPACARVPRDPSERLQALQSCLTGTCALVQCSSLRKKKTNNWLIMTLEDTKERSLDKHFCPLVLTVFWPSVVVYVMPHTY